MGGSSVSLTNALVVALFRHRLFGTAIFWIIGITLVLLAVATWRKWIPTYNVSPAGLAEPRSRTMTRLAFGALWIFDGVLQFQAAMPLGLANNVVRPMTAGTPSWLHSLMNDGVGIWNTHPIALAVGTAWIQVGIGVAILTSNGRVGRMAGLMSALWAALIWTIGAGFGGIFASSTSSILFGWPGATLFYAWVGVWLAARPTTFAERFSRWTARFMATVLALGALIQTLPSAGFWHGGNTNALAAMANTMIETPQPRWLAWLVRHVADALGSMGGGSNLLIILWLVGCAFGLWLAPARKWRWPTVTFVTGALFFWVVAQDTALFGGLATDVNSLVPMALLVFVADPRRATGEPITRRLSAEVRSGTGAVAAAFATAMIVFSVVSMGLASVSGAESTLYVARNGSAARVDTPAPTFQLTDQFGKPFTFGEHSGRTTVLTFLDPVCWTDCPLLAAQLKDVQAHLSHSGNVDFVAVAADPYHESIANVRHFIAKHQLGSMHNFYFVTGSLAKTKAVWNSYGITVTMKPTDKMSIHSDDVFLVSPNGHLRWIIPDDPLSSNAGQASAEQVMLQDLHSIGVR